MYKLFGFFFAIIVIIFSVNFIQAQGKTMLDEQKKENNAEFTVLKIEAKTMKFGSQMICGEIKNNTQNSYDYVQIVISLYDDSGAQIGSTIANILNLAPQSIWKFKAPVFQKDFANATITGITAY